MDKKEGHGMFSWPEGKKYEGDWKDNKQHGKGYYITKSGKRRLAKWENGKRIKWLE